MKQLVFILLLLLFTELGVRGQDECDIAVVASELSATAANLTSIQDLLLYQTSVQSVVTTCTMTDEESPGLTRSNPVPLGDWFTFPAGQFRVIEATLPETMPAGSFYTLPENHYILSLQVEYVCTIEDENTTCNGLDFAGMSVVANDATLIAGESSIRGDSIFGKQVFSSGTITGEIHFVLPDGVSAASVQFLNRWGDFEPIFFAVE